MQIGSRAQVMHGTAHHTSGGLTKTDLKYNKWGRIVSRKKSTMAKKTRRLEKAGYKAVKGKFGAVKKTRRGGADGLGTGTGSSGTGTGTGSSGTSGTSTGTKRM